LTLTSAVRAELTTSPPPSLRPKEFLDRFDGVKKTSWLRGNRDEIVPQIELGRSLIFCVNSYDSRRHFATTLENALECIEE
jgi:hypothetical protein